ncbi:MAG TPA: alpha/beta fold hydrolase [Thermoanaerobaculia bacterium]
MARRARPRFSVFRAAGIALLGIALALPLRAAHEEAGKTFAAPGATIYYEVLGGGPGTPLFVANGGPGLNHAYFHVSGVWDRLAKTRPVVFWDQRGNGRSDALKPGQSCTLADQIADLEALRAHLGYEKIDLLGHSWGGYLSMAYAARHPERIAHLVLLASAAPRMQDTRFLFEDVFPEIVEQRKALAYAINLGDEAAVEADLRAHRSMLFLSPEKRDAFLAATPTFTYRRPVQQAILADLARYDLNPELPKLRMPALVATGRYDINVAPAVSYRIHKAIPGSRFVVFERSGHMAFIEEPEAFQKVLEEFLAGR